uniref:TSA: Wollemia nobilis Ref_Wollemi_Transcript_15672_657 transcribed RNA sequence n=1 Tax=Wollemia nobilis TaxID=56998 RepID=A0A0C9QNS5_9CONI
MEAEKSGRRIMIAVDESEESMYALQWAMDHLVAPEKSKGETHFVGLDRLVIVHAENQMALTGQVALTPHVLEVIERRQKLNTERVLSRAKAICEGCNVNLETKMVNGDPRYAICEAAEKLKVNLLVIGSRGHGAIRRAVIGSVSNYCAHHAKCPVLIVKKQNS